VASVSYDDPIPHRSLHDEDGDQLTLQSGRSAIDFRYVAAAVRANLLLICAIIAGVVAVAVIATMLQTPRYTATATVQISDSVNRVLKTDDTQDSDMGGWDTDRNLKTQVDIIKSRGLAERVARQADHADTYESDHVAAHRGGRVRRFPGCRGWAGFGDLSAIEPLACN